MALIEFMVALTIGMVLTLGLLLLMSSTSKSYKVNDEFARMQESGSTALRFIGDDIRMAGFYGMAASTDAILAYDTQPQDFMLDYGQDVGINFGISAANDCGAANWSLQPTVPVFGLGPATDGAAANAALPCIPAANYVTGPAIVLRSAVGTMVNRDVNGFPTNFSSAQLDANTVYLQADPARGYFFRGADYNAYKNATYSRQVGSPAVDAPIYVFQAHIYYIRPCSRPTGPADSRGNPTCQASDDGGRPIPTLARQELQPDGGPSMREVGLVEGVEQMTVFYGLDDLSRGGTPVGCEQPGACANFPDGIADNYTATPANLTEWSRVVMVRLNLLVRASSPTAGYDDSPKSYDLGGAAAWNCIAAGAPCNYKRHIFSQQIQVRNIASRRSG
jgi:type IV pilus assembly protein PilW